METTQAPVQTHTTLETSPPPNELHWTGPIIEETETSNWHVWMSTGNPPYRVVRSVSKYVGIEPEFCVAHGFLVKLSGGLHTLEQAIQKAETHASMKSSNYSEIYAKAVELKIHMLPDYVKPEKETPKNSEPKTTPPVDSNKASESTKKAPAKKPISKPVAPIKKESVTMRLKIEREAAINLLEECGLKSAAEYSNKKIKFKLEGLKEKDEDVLTKKVADKNAKKLLAKVFKAEKIVITGEEESDDDEKPAKKKDKSEKKSRKTREGGPSNKEIVYKLWKKKAHEKFDAEAAFAATEENVKLTTIKSWASQWNRGKNLPACASKD